MVALQHERAFIDAQIEETNHQMREQTQTNTPSTPMISGLLSQEVALEERVQELENKLATLSLLLQQQHRPVVAPISPPPSPPASPPFDSPASPSGVGRGVIPLESPAPSRPLRIPMTKGRSLSYRLLQVEEDAQSHDSSSSNPSNLSPAESNIFMPDSLLESLPSTPKKEFFADEGEEEEETKQKLEKKKEKDVKGKWLDYLNSVQDSDYDTDKQMEEFVKIPSAVEALLGFGFWICVDSFLYTLTILPIRFFWSCLLLLRYTFIRATTMKYPAEGPFRFHRRHSYPFIQVSIVYIIYKFVLLPISIGKLYHWIRSQNMVKLYVLIAMVEIFDRLMCSLGQDCLDSLYWNTTRRPKSSRLLVSVAVVIVYMMCHSFLLFVHVATLNVAMNSDDQALLSLLIGGNFAEIKSTVFKKYNKANLFKITASDICERFKLALFLGIVLMLNISQEVDEKMIYSYFHMCGIVWCAEFLADWIKHSFITKFNFISSNIYPEYGLLLAGDVTGIGHEGVNLDNSHAVVKRIGLAQIPLVCVMVRYVKEAYKYATYGTQPPKWLIATSLFALWLFLLGCKHSLGTFLKKIAYAKLEAAPEFSSNNALLLKKKK